MKNLEKVQLFPKARAAIKYLVKDNRYDCPRLSLHFYRPMILRKLTA
ncbi:MAG: hypothetical protein IKR40_10230 [Treponema sp.]|nr:hypothetical protein [Treponema sp.]